MDNPEKLATRGTRDTGRRHTKQKPQWIIQRNWQHEEHKTQDKDIQSKKHNKYLVSLYRLWISMNSHPVHCIGCG